MSISPKVIDALVAAGCTGEQIAAAIKADIAEQTEKTEKKREKARERKRRQRERENEDGHEVSRNVTHSERDSAGQPSLSLPPLSSPQTPQQTPPTHTHPEHTPRASTSTRKADPFPCPDWADPTVWKDLKRNRKTKKLTNTETAHRQFVAKVEAMADDEWPPGRLLEAIVARGWGGPYDPREDRKPKNDRNRSQSSRDNRDGFSRLLDGELGFDSDREPARATG